LLDEIDSAVHGPDRRHDPEDPGPFSSQAFTCRAGGAFERAPAGDSLRDIASRLGRATSTLSREVADAIRVPETALADYLDPQGTA
jgi:hypothetical protein